MLGKTIVKKLLILTAIVSFLPVFARGGENYWTCISQQGDNTVLIETAWSDTVIRVGEKPHGLAFQKNRYGTEKYLWIVHRGDDSRDRSCKGINDLDTSGRGSVWVVDLSTHETVAKIPLGRGSAHIAIVTKGRPETMRVGSHEDGVQSGPKVEELQLSNPAYAFVTNELDDDVSVIDIWSRKVIKSIPVGVRPHRVRLSPDQKYICVANLGSGDISLIDPFKFEVAKTVKVGRAPFGMDFTPDTKYLYVSLSGENALVKVDCASWEVLDKISVGDNPLGVRVSLPTGRYVYVACPGTGDNPDNSVFKINTISRKIVAKIKVGKGCSELEIGPREENLSVINTLDNTITGILTGTSSVIGTKAIGNCPTDIVSYR